jgi:hypothetical protein
VAGLRGVLQERVDIQLVEHLGEAFGVEVKLRAQDGRARIAVTRPPDLSCGSAQAVDSIRGPVVDQQLVTDLFEDESLGPSDR